MSERVTTIFECHHCDKSEPCLYKCGNGGEASAPAFCPWSGRHTEFHSDNTTTAIKHGWKRIK